MVCVRASVLLFSLSLSFAMAFMRPAVVRWWILETDVKISRAKFERPTEWLGLWCREENTREPVKFFVFGSAEVFWEIFRVLLLKNSIDL